MRRSPKAESKSARRSTPEPFVARLTLRALAREGRALERYGRVLTKSCRAHPPPYGQAWYGETYRKLAADPRWLANSLIANASKEGEGSRKLWNLVARVEDEAIAEQVRLHAIDESRHALIYIALLNLAFPKAVGAAQLRELRRLSPGYASTDRPTPLEPSTTAIVMDELVQMNIGEIRTRIHQLMLRPVITLHCPANNRAKLGAMMDALLDDETRHIAYTAKIINDFADRSSRTAISNLFSRRLSDFNDITLEEVGQKSFDGA